MLLENFNSSRKNQNSQSEIPNNLDPMILLSDIMNFANHERYGQDLREYVSHLQGSIPYGDKISRLSFGYIDIAEVPINRFRKARHGRNGEFPYYRDDTELAETILDKGQVRLAWIRQSDNSSKVVFVMTNYTPEYNVYMPELDGINPDELIPSLWGDSQLQEQARIKAQATFEAQSGRKLNTDEKMLIYAIKEPDEKYFGNEKKSPFALSVYKILKEEEVVEILGEKIIRTMYENLDELIEPWYYSSE